MSVAPVNQAPNNPPGRAQLVSSDGYTATYRAAISATTPVAAPTDMLQLIGSATMLIRIKRIAIGGIATTAGLLPISVIRRSTAGTIGSAVVTAIVTGQHDKSDVAPTMSVGVVGTANWGTVGTTAGLIDTGRCAFPLVTAGATGQLVFDFCTRQQKALILRGTSDYIYLNGNGATLPAGCVIDYAVEWEEVANGTF